MENIKHQNEYEGYINLEFQNPNLVNQFLINYHVYEQYWNKQSIQGLFVDLNQKFNEYFEHFEVIIMKKEPDQTSVQIFENDKIVVKIWIVCCLNNTYWKDDIETNKQLIIDVIQNRLIDNIEKTYQCQATLKYLDVAPDIND